MQQGYYYLGQPYTDESAEIRQIRYEAALTCIGYFHTFITIYSPIVHYHNMAIACDTEVNFKAFKMHNENMLQHASGLLVFKLIGWADSEGLTWEINCARTLHKPVFYLTNKLELEGL